MVLYDFTAYDNYVGKRVIYSFHACFEKNKTRCLKKANLNILFQKIIHSFQVYVKKTVMYNKCIVYN